MNVTRKSNKRVIVSIVMALMIALSMMPGMAFADTQNTPNNNGAVTVAADSIAIAPLTETVYVGDQKTLTATVTTEVTPYHVEWTSSDTSVATISRKNAKLIGLSAGTTTITATLLTGEADAADSAILATASMDVVVAATEAYGFQGTGGQTMKLTNPSDIIVKEIAKDDSGVITKYINTISSRVAPVDGAYNFEFTMSAGMNDFDETLFKTASLPYITVLNADGTKCAELQWNGYDAATKTIKLKANLAQNTSYTLQFGAQVRGNNSAKTLGVPITFDFKTKR